MNQIYKALGELHDRYQQGSGDWLDGKLTLEVLKALEAKVEQLERFETNFHNGMALNKSEVATLAARVEALERKIGDVGKYIDLDLVSRLEAKVDALEKRPIIGEGTPQEFLRDLKRSIERDFPALVSGGPQRGRCRFCGEWDNDVSFHEPRCCENPVVFMPSTARKNRSIRAIVEEAAAVERLMKVCQPPPREADAGTQEAGATNWSQSPPNHQDWYWHWNGDKDSDPVPMMVYWSGTSQKAFIPSGQLGIQEAVDCDVYGGWWAPLKVPSTKPPPPAPAATERQEQSAALVDAFNAWWEKEEALISDDDPVEIACEAYQAGFAAGRESAQQWPKGQFTREEAVLLRYAVNRFFLALGIK